MGRNKQKKRKKSSDDCCEHNSKTARNGGSRIQHIPLSETLRGVRSTLFDQDFGDDMDQLFSTPPASPSKLAKSRMSKDQDSGLSFSCGAGSSDSDSVLSYLKRLDSKLTSMDNKLKKFSRRQGMYV